MIVISDACVLIDIEQSELTSKMFNLPFKFTVPDVLFAEELNEKHALLISYGLKIETLSSKLVTEAFNLRQKNPRLSVNDLLALTLAKSRNNVLLTGDKALRKIAYEFNLEVHGTIWVVEQMHNHNLLSKNEVKDAFVQMKMHGSRLPWSIIEKKFQIII